MKISYLFLTAVFAEVIQWELVGNDFAKSTLTSGDAETTLSSSGRSKGAQFPYSKKGKASSLYTVYLASDNTKWELQSGFDVIAQSCSCYFLDVTTSFTSHPDISSGEYRILFESPDEQLFSGKFNLKLSPGNSTKSTGLSLTRLPTRSITSSTMSLTPTITSTVVPLLKISSASVPIFRFTYLLIPMIALF